MKKLLIALLLTASSVSFADVVTGPDFSNGLSIAEIVADPVSIVLTGAMFALLTGGVLFLRRYKKG